MFLLEKPQDPLIGNGSIIVSKSGLNSFLAHERAKEPIDLVNDMPTACPIWHYGLWQKTT